MKQPPLAYDFYGGVMRVWLNGEYVGYFPRSYFKKMGFRLINEAFEDIPHDKLQ